MYLTIDCEADGESPVEEADLRPDTEDSPGKPQLGQGQAAGQQEGHLGVPAAPHAT